MLHENVLRINNLSVHRNLYKVLILSRNHQKCIYFFYVHHDVVNVGTDWLQCDVIKIINYTVEIKLHLVKY